MGSCPAEHGTAPLSPRQLQVLRFIAHCYEETGLFPSERQIAFILGLHHSVVQEHIAVLYRRGYLRTPTPAGLRCLHVP